MQLIYKIAGIQIGMQIPFDIYVSRESEAFVRITESVSELKSCQIYLCFHSVENVPSMKQGGHWEITQYYEEDEEELRVFHCRTPMGEPYACIIWKRSDLYHPVCLYREGMEHCLNYSRNLCDILGLPFLLQLRHGVLLHASLIRIQDKGILFSAPSGTGKSTQAALWEQYENAEILNGDRAGLVPVKDHYLAYGLPYAGSSHIYRNESAQVAAIIVLRQAQENRIRRLQGAEAFSALFTEMSVYHWSRKLTEAGIDALAEMLRKVPVFLLQCLPDQGAVETVKRVLFSEKEAAGKDEEHGNCTG